MIRLRWIARRMVLPVLLVAAAIVACVAVLRDRDGITVSYSPRFDALCSMLHGPPVDQAWQAELESRLAEYRALWSRVGPRLLSRATLITGLEQPHGQNVRLTLCSLPSQSLLGISVNMRFALRSFTATPVPLRYKADTQFHELLHRMLDGHVPRDSALIAAHADATACVKNHLHLLALQKAVLLAEHDVAPLADVVWLDSALPSDCYREAWRIINATESAYLAYVQEISD